MEFLSPFAALALPPLEEVVRVVTLQNYNTRLVVLSTALLGFGCGLVGSFLLLRKRSLMSDALSHATLPGIAVAFMVMVALGGSGKSLPGLLLGATVTGVIGFLLMLAIRNFTLLKDDTAMGIVLSVFFGAGVALLGIVQSMPTGSAAGLESFIYGKTASMVMADFKLLLAVLLAVLGACLLLLKELRLLCFDEAFAKSQGWPVRLLDVILLALVTAITVAGLQAVGLILIIAFLITPAATARLWTHDLHKMLWIAAIVGALSGWVGASLSALAPRLPAGAVIVLTTSFLFLLSLLLGPHNGLIARAVRLLRLRRRTGRQHLLRAVYELLEKETQAADTAQPPKSLTMLSRPKDAAAHAAAQQSPTCPCPPIRFEAVLARRSWNEAALRAILRNAYREALVASAKADTITLTDRGLREAARITRNHRLWELYLILHADVAPAQVDRNADAIEHILNPELIRELEAELASTAQLEGKQMMPHSPHPIH